MGFPVGGRKVFGSVKGNLVFRRKRRFIFLDFGWIH